jgi:hypothetical protein
MSATPIWRQPDGAPIACREKLRVLEENHAELAIVMQDAFEDAVLMGVDPELARKAISDLVARLRLPGQGAA